MTRVLKETTPGRYQPPHKSWLSLQELQILDRELQPFCREVFSTILKRNVTMVDEIPYMATKGAVTLNGKNWAVKVSNFHDNDCDPIPYEQLSEDIAQWKKWKSTVQNV